MKVFHPGKLSVLALSITLSSCATFDQAGRDYGTAIGCAGGAILGAGLTYAVTGNAGKAVAGGLVGGAAGCAIGHVWQNRQQELQRIAKEENLKMQVDTLQAQAPAANGKAASTTDAGIVAQVEDQGMFPTASDQLTADGLRQVRKLATVFKPADATAKPQAILVVGHTDATGSAEFNQQLSERRARSVGKVLAEAGIPAQSLYFQGVGAARPLADNTTADGRAQNRRVEIVQLESTALLEQRVKQERSNPRYLAHGTRSQAVAKAKPAPVAVASQKTPVADKPVAALPANFIDFGGSPAADDNSQLARLVKPLEPSGLTLISKAYASAPVSSCDTDRPRVMGAVKNLASGQELTQHETTDYLPGLNGRVWANNVNGNLVTITPIAVLRDNAQIAKQPRVQLVKGYDQNKKGKATTLNAVANTFEGQDTLLYRVFIDDDQAPVSCMDVVLEKFGGKAADGKLFYDKSGESYVAKFVPIRT
ncbi:MAG: OmpA family protein [Pseudomonas sp.]|uniref:OmpA family protein n=1 Tax=Pseudomonas abieticivorans TaxID=2931382 RepID=UPI0020C05EEE|nr:OmpA family protein [Pseudomonas sp. PIA16]MDE1166655.1 OmpA family protein [Pseudomonas sp.]